MRRFATTAATVFVLAGFGLVMALYQSATAQGMDASDLEMIQQGQEQSRQMLKDAEVGAKDNPKILSPERTREILDSAGQNLETQANRVPIVVDPPPANYDVGELADHYEKVKQGVQKQQQGLGTKGYLVFISESMRKESLVLLAQQVKSRTDSRLVLRGMINNSTKQTMQFIAKHELQGAQIDPRLYRAFDIKSVPTFVYFDQDQWVGLSGDVSLAFAIEKLAQHKDQMSPVPRLN